MYPEKKYRNLFFTLNENIKHPFFILDKDANLISYNTEAASKFLIPKDLNNFYKIFNETTAVRIRKLIAEIRATGKPVSENLIVGLYSGKQYKSIIKLNSFSEPDDYLIFCSIIIEENKLSLTETGKIFISSGDLKSLIKNNEIYELVNEIKSLYPFTFLGKEKIRRKVDRLNELFWIKDVDDNYMLVNNKVAESMGINTTLIEGKKEASFIPPHLQNFNQAIELFIKESSNNVVIEGIPFKGVRSKNTRVIEIPLKDADNNILAIVGFTQKKEENFTLSGVFDVTLENIPVALAVINCSGIIESSTPEIKKYLQVINDIRGKYFKEIFHSEISDKIEEFLNASANYDEKYLEELHAKIFLSKIFGNEDTSEDIAIFVKEDEGYNIKKNEISWSSNMTDQILLNSPEPVFIYNRDTLKFLNVNDAALQLYGYTKEEFLQLDLTDLYEPESIQSLVYTNDSAKEGVFSEPIVHIRKDGKKVLVKISKININYNNQNSFYTFIKDITGENELKQKEQLVQFTLENTDDIVLITDSSGFITSSNPGAAKSLGYTEKELINSTFISIVKDEDRGRINSAVFHSQDKIKTSFKSSLKTKNSELIDAEIIFTPVLDINSAVAYWSVLAKTKKETKEEKENATPIPQGINQEYLSGIFHEILTPINVILGFVQELTEGIPNMNADQKESVSIIDQNRKNLLNIMNSIVEYASVQSEKKIKVEEISVTKMLDDIQNELEKLSSFDTEFAYGRISSSLKFKSDPGKFIKFVILLFSIVSRLSKEKKLYFSAYQIDDEKFIISFRDNYSFTSESLSEKIRLLLNDDRKIKEFGISRLNLLLAKELLSLLNGEFQVIRNGSQIKDSGFIFSLNLPQVSEVKVETPQQIIEEENQSTDEEIDFSAELNAFKPAVEPNKAVEEEVLTEIKTSDRHKVELSKLNCLYIEDQVDSQILFKVQMKDLNQIKFAIDFEDALPLFDENKFDFIVMDINLPGDYNGLDALRIIRKIPSYETIPVIAATAYLLPGNKEKFISAGFTDFIEKPLFRDKIIKSLEKIF